MLRAAHFVARALISAGAELRRWSVGSQKLPNQSRPFFQLTLLKVDVVLPRAGWLPGKRS
jgi:hypothetical protein